MLGDTDDINETRSEFLLRYYSSSQDIPKRIVIDEEIPEQELVERYIAERADKKVTLLVPKRGEQVKLIEMARSNCAEQLSQQTKADGRDVAALDELAGLLGLSHTPQYIEAYDISNIGSSSMVAGMVVFENAKPLKSAYKRFAIKEQTGQNDYAAMSEVISRRIARYFEEKETGTGFGRLPDLILLDGGKGHVSVIAPIIKASGLDIPLYGMVKDDKHRTRAIATNGGEISVSSHKSAFMLLVKIQNEVHRFSIEYQRKKHKKTNLESELLTIEGIGEKRMQALFKRFKTVKAIREADVEELKTAEGITEAAAQAVYRHFHG